LANGLDAADTLNLVAPPGTGVPIKLRLNPTLPEPPSWKMPPPPSTVPLMLRRVGDAAQKRRGADVGDLETVIIRGNGATVDDIAGEGPVLSPHKTLARQEHGQTIPSH
jgi:hypothetical protein